jgi:hypothetical protein
VANYFRTQPAFDLVGIGWFSALNGFPVIGFESVGKNGRCQRFAGIGVDGGDEKSFLVQSM